MFLLLAQVRGGPTCALRHTPATGCPYPRRVPRESPTSHRRWQHAPDWLLRFAEIGALPSDSEEVRLRKSVLVLSASIMALAAVVWVATYAVLGVWRSAALPLVYQLASAASILTFARKRHYRLFRTSQLAMSLLLPFALQWSLGGFRTSSAVALWGLTCPVGALLFIGARQAVPWFLAFVGLVMVSAAIDSMLASGAPSVPNGIVLTFFALNTLGVSTTVYVLLQYFVRARDRALADSERLLLNVLPAPVAARLKQSEGVIADGFQATVLFADIVGFTGLSQRLEPAEIVAMLDRIFGGWDQLATLHGLEKIKTIGDAYMVAGGLPTPRPDHAEAVADMALQMGAQLSDPSLNSGNLLEVRIGIDTGPVVAGVIGRTKFIYDLWGDTVNTASRMESHGIPGAIQVTERAYQRLVATHELRHRGTIEVKGKGPTTTYLLIGKRDASNADAMR